MTNVSVSSSSRVVSDDVCRLLSCDVRSFAIDAVRYLACPTPITAPRRTDGAVSFFNAAICYDDSADAPTTRRCVDTYTTALTAFSRGLLYEEYRDAFISRNIQTAAADSVLANIFAAIIRELIARDGADAAIPIRLNSAASTCVPVRRRSGLHSARIISPDDTLIITAPHAVSRVRRQRRTQNVCELRFSHVILCARAADACHFVSRFVSPRISSSAVTPSSSRPITDESVFVVSISPDKYRGAVERVRAEFVGIGAVETFLSLFADAAPLQRILVGYSRKAQGKLRRCSRGRTSPRHTRCS